MENFIKIWTLVKVGPIKAKKDGSLAKSGTHGMYVLMKNKVSVYQNYIHGIESGLFDLNQVIYIIDLNHDLNHTTIKVVYSNYNYHTLL